MDAPILKMTAKPEPKLRRDGVWTANGLASDFRLIYTHPNSVGLYRVETASGEAWATAGELRWDDEKQP